MTLQAGFLRQCHLIPDALAFTEDEIHINYAQFRENSQSIAALIQQNLPPFNDSFSGIPPGVALFLERGINAATAIYGVLMAGAMYIPLDIYTPTERINYIINDAQPVLVIGLGDCPTWLAAKEKWLDLKNVTTGLLYQSCTVDENSLAAILYTSGSTGLPKGIALTHAAMHNFSAWATKTFALTDNDRIASLAPFHFDLSVFDLFSALSAGASVHFMSAKLTLSPSKLTNWLSEKAITCWYTVPSILCFIALKGLNNISLPELKTLLFAGEVFPTPQLITLANQLPHVNLYNLYGPTETNVCCYWPVDRTYLNPQFSIPIGFSACNAKLKIKPDTGELLVQSDNNFSGYWQQGHLKLNYPRNSWHATGDKVSINERGEYCYHGRIDRMLKCAGYRVEPAEIEHALHKLPGVENCAVIGANDFLTGQYPVAAVVLSNGFTLTNIMLSLKEILPSYMIPRKFLVLKSLPKLSNGKIDLPKIDRLFNGTL